MEAMGGFWAGLYLPSLCLFPRWDELADRVKDPEEYTPD
jgi:hypothetical protein